MLTQNNSFFTAETSNPHNQDTQLYQHDQVSLERSQMIHSRLPSFQAMHSVGGATLARKRLAEQRSQVQWQLEDETFNTALLRDNNYRESNTTADVAFIENGLNNFSNVAMTTSKIFSEDFTYKDIHSLRELRCNMKKKKEIRTKLIADHGTTEIAKKLSPNSKANWHKVREDFADSLYELELWGSSIHEIEGRFGTGIRTYFDFLRWLFVLNFYIFLLIFSFILVPTFVFEDYRDSGYIKTIEQGRNISEECIYSPYDPNSITNFPQYVIWWFTGQGFMENTLLFSGYYDNAMVNVTSSEIDFYYNLPLAFLLVSFFYFLLSLAFILRRATIGVKQSLADDDQLYSYCNLVFGGWDYCITDDKAASLKHRSLKNELQTNLDDENIKRIQANRTRNEKIVLYTKRIFINFLVLLILAGALFAIYSAAQYALLQNSVSDIDENFFFDLLVTYLTSIVITAVNFIAPFIFEFIVKKEDYSPEFSIRFTLIRVVFLRLASVIFLYVVVYFQVNCEQFSFNPSSYNKLCDSCKGTECWETYFGQEMYKLTLFDFFAVIGLTLLVEFPRKLIVDHCSFGLAKWLGQQEFSIPINVLDIVYAQTIGWIGAFYAPLLPLMMVIKFFIYFYLKKLTLIYNCRPSTRPYRASKFASFFFIMLIMALGVAIFPVVVGVSVMTPSIDCGPFRRWPSMFYAITLSIQANLPDWAQQLFWFFGSPVFAAIIIVILSLILYYYLALESAHKELIEVLKNQLTLEGKDKQFLLSRFNSLSEELRKHASLFQTEPAFVDNDLRGQENRAYVMEVRNGDIPGQLNSTSSID